MNRPKDVALREEILRKAVAHALAHGVSSLSLRPLGAAIGVSARMLLHHFGSKEQLLAEILAEIERAFAARLMSRLAAGEALPALVAAFWREMSDPALEPLLRALYDAWGRALVAPEAYAGFLGTLVAPFRDALSAHLRALGLGAGAAAAEAALILATLHGLALQRLTTGAPRATDQAMRRFLAHLETLITAPARLPED